MEKRVILELGKPLDRLVLKEHSSQREPGREHRGTDRQRMVEEIQDNARCKKREMHQTVKSSDSVCQSVDFIHR